MDLIAAVLSLLAVAVALLAWVARREIRQAALAHELVHNIAALAPSPLPIAPRSLLDHPEESDGWIFTTGDGTCALISEGARSLLGVDRSLPPQQAWLPALLRDGGSLVDEMMNVLRERSVFPARHARAIADANQSLEVAGVALRDRAGGLWGAALLIRSLPSGHSSR